MEIENFSINGQKVEIPKCILLFNKWTGEPVKETFGGKPIVSFDDKPMFAEIAIMTSFHNDGWDARWVETYGRRNKEPICLSEWKDDKYKNQIHTPIEDNEIAKLLADIAKINSNSYSGCWDVMAWKGHSVIFAETKRTKKDSIRVSQKNWLAAGLKYGLRPNHYLVVQWEIE
jgi:hypothetical protein